MPVYQVQAPSGKVYDVEGPAGASADQLGQFILSQNKDERVAQTSAQMAKEYAPTVGMSTGQRLLAGIGQGMTDMARGAGQWVGAVSRDDVREARQLDAPLMATTAGKVGSFIGKAAPLAAAPILAPATATVGGAAGLGALAGALEPSESTGETVANIGLGGAFGAGGQKLGNAITDALRARVASRASQFATQQAGNAQRMGAAREAGAAGYVIPPSDIQPQGALMEALGGLSGKIKTAQQASAKNQGVTDSLAKKAVGLSDDDALTRDALKTIRQQAGAAYDQFRTVGPVQADAAYNAALDAVQAQSKGAARSFPGLGSNEIDDIVKTMRQPSFDAGDAIDATKVLRDLADGAYGSGNKQLGKAYRGISDALENSLERSLASTSPDAVSAFREARALIAKTYTVESALNGETGNVSAQALAQKLKKGKPLSSELETIAKAGEAFPRATQALKESPKQLSPLDFAAALGGFAGSGGNPLAAAGLVARPLTREALLSGPIQQLAMRDRSAPSSMLLKGGSSPLMQLLYGPAAATAGANLGQK